MRDGRDGARNCGLSRALRHLPELNGRERNGTQGAPCLELLTSAKTGRNQMADSVGEFCREKVADGL